MSASSNYIAVKKTLIKYLTIKSLLFQIKHNVEIHQGVFHFYMVSADDEHRKKDMF